MTIRDKFFKAMVQPKQWVTSTQHIKSIGSSTGCLKKSIKFNIGLFFKEGDVCFAIFCYNTANSHSISVQSLIASGSENNQTTDQLGACWTVGKGYKMIAAFTMFESRNRIEAQGLGVSNIKLVPDAQWRKTKEQKQMQKAESSQGIAEDGKSALWKPQTCRIK